MAYPSIENSIILDMKRMDRIIEIDEKNMFAIIEPRVIGAQLQAEAMKVGLNTHIIGAGASCSPLASVTSYQGSGPDTPFMGYGDENMLGVEWIMPDGEIMRTGALGAGIGWFCGEGPGPGIRGIIRGLHGAKGGMGVFTKVAVKLYPWPGPTVMPVEGKAPVYRAPLPGNFKAYTISFPSWTAYADGAHKIWDAGIGYTMHRQYAMFGRELKAAMFKIITDPTKTLDNLDEMLKEPDIPEKTKERLHEFEIVLVGMTDRDIEWQDNALESILAETGGWKVKIDDKTMQWQLLYFLKLGKKGINNVFGGTWDSSLGLIGPPDYGTQYIEEMVAYRKSWEEKGALVATGGDSAMGPVAGFGGGGIIAFDNFFYFDPYDKESTEGACEYCDAQAKYVAEHKYGPEFSRANALSRGADGLETPQDVRNKALGNTPTALALRYQAIFKKMLDPNNIGDKYYMWIDD
jgi:glycolate oxidase